MTARVLQLGAAHDDTEALLPWFVNGSLSPDEREQVARHLEECAHCRSEVLELRAFHSEYAVETPMPESGHAFDRLRAILPDRRVPWNVRMALRWRSFRQAYPQRWLPWAIAGQLALIVALGVLVLSPDRPLPYETLGSASGITARTGGIVVVFAPDTRVDEMRKIVRAANARIVDGPTATDAYVLDVPNGNPTAVLQALRGQRAVVLAEPLQGAR
jgi:hypothetical protein